MGSLGTRLSIPRMRFIKLHCPPLPLLPPRGTSIPPDVRQIILCYHDNHHSEFLAMAQKRKLPEEFESVTEASAAESAVVALCSTVSAVVILRRCSLARCNLASLCSPVSAAVILRRCSGLARCNLACPCSPISAAVIFRRCSLGRCSLAYLCSVVSLLILLRR